MKLQTGGAECAAADQEQQLVPPVGRRQKRALIGNCQATMHAFAIIISVISLTMSSIVFMVLLFTPVSSPLGQALAVADLREVVDMQRQMIGRLQRENNYQDAKQKALQSALGAAGLLTDDVTAQLDGIERAMMAKEHEVSKDSSSLIGRPDGHERGRDALIGRPDGHERFRPAIEDRSESKEESYED